MTDREPTFYERFLAQSKPSGPLSEDPVFTRCRHRNLHVEWRDTHKPDAPPTAYGQWYRCGDCGHEWRGGHQ